MNREHLIATEEANRKLLAQHKPELLTPVEIIEDDALLKKFGIVFPHPRLQNTFSLKQESADFIVQEVDQDGIIHTIDKNDDENILRRNDFTGKTIYATLVKENMNTLDAISVIAKKLSIQTKDITYCGLKDKDAITAQSIAIRNSTVEDVREVKSDEFFLKNIYQGKGVLHPGSLTGNSFTITLRGSVNEKDFDAVKKNIAHIEEHGFYNFFYLQRFGVPRLCNFVWAIEILKGNFEKACIDYLTRKTEYEFEFIKNIRKNLTPHIGDWEKILHYLEMFPLAFQTEITIVRHLIEKPNDFKGALFAIREQVQLWTYGFASLLFNTRLSELAREQNIPDVLPTFISDMKEDFDFYKNLLGPLGLQSLPFSIFNYYAIPIQKRDTPTVNHVIVKRVEQIPGGIILEFTLPKGSYATTFLSHLVTLKTSATPLAIK